MEPHTSKLESTQGIYLYRNWGYKGESTPELCETPRWEMSMSRRTPRCLPTSASRTIRVTHVAGGTFLGGDVPRRAHVTALDESPPGANISMSLPSTRDDGDFLAAVAAAVVHRGNSSSDENESPNPITNRGTCVPLQQQQPPSSSLLYRSPAAWLDDVFNTDPTDQLLGSFTCAYAAHILIQGKLFVVRGSRQGARVFFFSNIMRYGAVGSHASSSSPSSST